MIVASTIGGLYSLIILVPSLPEWAVAISKIAVAMIMVGVAIKFYKVNSFIIATIIFFFSSLAFLGVIIGIYMIFKSDLIVVNNSSIYFNISARGLLGCSFVAYILSSIIVRLYNRALSKKELYTVVVQNGSKSVNLFAFVDSGNKLREPFSNAPVIIAQREKVEKIIGSSKTRCIPASTISSSAILTGFKPDKVTIKTSKGKEVLDNVYIAMSDEINGNGFSAILSEEILSI